MKDDEIQARWRALDQQDIDNLCQGLRSHERQVQGFLCEIVASVCDVDKDDLLKSTDNVSVAHARWLFWYALRFLTNETYEKMVASINHEYGFSFRARSITSGVNKMATMIERDDLWKDRWRIVKHVIGLRTQGTQQAFDFSKKITITIPKELKGKVEIKYTE